MVSKYVTYLHEITSNEKRSHGFARARRGVFGRVWREGKDGRNDAIHTRRMIPAICPTHTHTHTADTFIHARTK